MIQENIQAETPTFIFFCSDERRIGLVTLKILLFFN